MDLSIVFSFRNEELTIRELVSRMEKVMRPLGITYEMIFVNDASSDRSLEILTELRHTKPEIRVINMSRTFGNAPCKMAGLRYAVGESVLIMDSDLQDPPELIPEMWAEFKKGADVVYTTRRRRAGENPIKMAITYLAYRVLRDLSDIKLPVDSGDFKLMSKRVVREVAKFNEYDPFLRGLISWVGFKQVQVFYDRDARHGGDTHFPLFSRYPFRAFLAGLTSFSTMPLEAALIFGFGMSAVALCYLVAVVTMFFMGWNIPGWTTIIGVFLIGFSTQLTLTGINGIYLGRIFQNVQNRPLYVVENTVGFENASISELGAPPRHATDGIA